MTCNAPLNIVKSADKCSLKCLYFYKYGNSTCTVTNATDQLTIPYDGDSDVLFNSIKYNPVEVKIFMPSIHKFDGSYADAEMVIVHTGSSGGLFVCIPITTSTSTNASTGTNLLTDIIKNTPDKNSSSLNLQDFNLNYFIPKSSYFSYTGTRPYGECVSDVMYNYIVFPKNSLTVNKALIAELGNLIHDSYIPVYEGTCFWNEKGTTTNGFSGDGNIWIDCQPTGEEGEIIYKEQLSSSSQTVNMDWIYSFLYVIIGIILMYGGLLFFKFVLRMVTGSEKKGSKPV
jgi:hypothetical protein